MLLLEVNKSCGPGTGMAGQKQNVATDKPKLNREGLGGGRGDGN